MQQQPVRLLPGTALGRAPAPAVPLRVLMTNRPVRPPNGMRYGTKSGYGK